MLSTLSLVIIGSDRPSADATAECLKPFAGDVTVLGAFTSFQDAMKIIPTDNPHIVILEVKEMEQGVKDVSYILSRFPGTSIVVTAADKNPDWILRLIRAGASEYLVQPLDAADLMEAVKKLSRFHAQRTGDIRKKGSVISVYNPCGGIGTTTIAVNLAATLAAQSKKVALVDLNLLNSDVTTFLDLAPRYTVASIIAKAGQVDANFLRTVMVSHPSGVHVLNGPADLAEAERVVPEQLQEVIGVLQTMFNYIVIDTGGRLSGGNLAVFNYSDHILFNTILQPSALSNTKTYCAALNHEGIGADKVKLVVNRHNPKGEIKVADAETELHAKVYHVLPNAYAEAMTSIHKGVPWITCFPRSVFAKEMDDLARKLMLAGEPYRKDLPGVASMSWHLGALNYPLGDAVNNVPVAVALKARHA